MSTNPPTCTVDASCAEGAHSRSWPCDYAPGTGRLYRDNGDVCPDDRQDECQGSARAATHSGAGAGEPAMNTTRAWPLINAIQDGAPLPAEVRRQLAVLLDGINCGAEEQEEMWQAAAWRSTGERWSQLVALSEQPESTEVSRG